jgi:hypothetical protein
VLSVSSTNNTDLHDITELLLKMALNIITYISPLMRTKLVNFLVAITNFPMIVDKVQISTNYKKSILKFSVILFIALVNVVHDFLA